jgi:hypothetical protein
MTIDRSTGGAQRGRGMAVLFGGVAMAIPAIAFGGDTDPASGGMVSVFGPLFVLSIAIERFWETLFTGIEHSTLVFGGLMSALHRPVDDLRKTLEQAQKNYDAAKRLLTGDDSSGRTARALDAGLVEAEAALDEVRRRVVEVVDDPVYVRFKRRVILYGSPALGLLVAWKGHVAILHTMGLREVPPVLDMVLTGIVIGSGSEPMHGLVSSVTNFNKALGNVADLARRDPRDAIRPGRSDPQ